MPTDTSHAECPRAASHARASSSRVRGSASSAPVLGRQEPVDAEERVALCFAQALGDRVPPHGLGARAAPARREPLGDLRVGEPPLAQVAVELRAVLRRELADQDLFHGHDGILRKGRAADAGA
jgi:hypothetical protein